MRWSQWLESMRKDVECTFGILKKRFTILDKGVEARNIGSADKVWMTCCALHNMLLEVDGYAEMWEGSIASVPTTGGIICFAISRLHDVIGEIPEGERVEQNGEINSGNDAIREVRKMTQDAFRKKLVEHFDIMFNEYAIVWPTRISTPRSV